MGPGAPPHAARPRGALVFTGGDRPAPASVRDLPSSALVIAADSGLDHALALGFHVDVVVGDLDSVAPEALDRARAEGSVVEQHPTAKDATDLELALAAAGARSAHEVVVIGGAGGRLDHFLANVLVLASPSFAGLRVAARVGEAELHVIRDHVDLRGARGDLCSLLALGGPAHGVRTAGLLYPLDHETLFPGSTRGVSNELVEPIAEVTLEAGVLLAVLPHARREA
jgi:thiamine pyrophosphokinase